jgi:hypothetical protein
MFFLPVALMNTQKQIRALRISYRWQEAVFLILCPSNYLVAFWTITHSKQ